MPIKPLGLAVRAVLVDDQNRCLLLRRSQLNKRFAGQWEWPGGKAEKEEGVFTALIRETEEETGLKICPTRLVGAVETELPLVRVIILCLEATTIGGEFKVSDEHDDAAWVPFEKFATLPLSEQTRHLMLQYASQKMTSTSAKS